MILSISRYWTEVYWASFSFLNKNLNKRSKQLKTLLRKHPSWKKGHLLFAFNELERLMQSPIDGRARAVASIRVSAQAIAHLSRAERENTADGIIEVQFLLAVVLFLEKKFSAAKSSFDRLLESQKEQLEKNSTLLYQLLEYAGASAMAIKENGRAENYFSQIPLEQRSPEIRSALSYLASTETYSTSFTQS